MLQVKLIQDYKMVCNLDINKFYTLPFSEKLLLWAIRLWVRSHNGKVNGHEMLMQGFKLAGAPDAHAATDDFMSVLAHGARTSIDVRCSNCLEVSIDEQRILGVVANFQAGGNREESMRWLSIWLPLAARRIIEQPGERIAQSLAGAGLIVRPRSKILPHNSNLLPSDYELSTIH